MGLSMVPEVHNEFLVLLTFSARLLCLHHYVSYISTSHCHCLIANNCGVECKLDDLVVAVYGCTIMCEQRVRQWAEAATLRHSGVEDQSA